MLGQVGVYDIEGWVARRPDGGVCRARDRGLGRVVALKHVANPASPEAGQLRREARMLAGLTHPHIVSVFDLIENPGGLWLVEEWVDGAALFGVIAQSGRLTPTQGIGVVHAALEGLAYAHGRGVAHGDVTLGNILVDRSGVSKLVDFGLARPIWKPTQTGWAVAGLGTPGFASPQIVQGQPATPADDVYSAGVVLASLLLGRALFTGTTPQAVLAAQFHSLPQGPPDLAGISPNVRAVLTKALAAERADRYPDAGPFLAALDDAAERDHGPGWLAEASLAGVMAALGGAAVTGVMAAGTVASGGVASGGVATGTAAAGTATSATTASTSSLQALAAGQIKTRGRAGRIAQQARRVSTAGHGAVAAGAVALVVAVVATVAIVKPFSSPPDPVKLTAGQQRPQSTASTNAAATQPASAVTPSSASTSAPGFAVPSGLVGPGTDCGPVESVGVELHVLVTAGQITCAQAIHVMVAYRSLPYDPTAGSGQFLTVEGWDCNRNSLVEHDATGVFDMCARNGVAIETKATNPAGGGFATPTPAATAPGAVTGGPEAIVKLYFSYYLKKDWSGQCSLLSSDQRDACSSGSRPTKVSGSVQVVGSVIHGKDALVALVGKVCQSYDDGTSYCSTNENPDSGMPKTSADFESKLQAAQTADQSRLGPLPCQFVDGQWYVGSVTPAG